jgi:carboxyl-terminal processing protease
MIHKLLQRGFVACSLIVGTLAPAPLGSPMAGLHGALYDGPLPRTRFTVRIPAERLYHVDGTPREAWAPSVRPDAPRNPGDDPALDAALELLRAP